MSAGNAALRNRSAVLPYGPGLTLLAIKGGGSGALNCSALGIVSDGYGA